jgi:hypothetical protein
MMIYLLATPKLCFSLFDVVHLEWDSDGTIHGSALCSSFCALLQRGRNRWLVGWVGKEEGRLRDS